MRSHCQPPEDFFGYVRGHSCYTLVRCRIVSLDYGPSPRQPLSSEKSIAISRVISGSVNAIS
jgi:hypothetical protein